MHANDNEGMKISEGLQILDECLTDWNERRLNLEQRKKLTFKKRKYIKDKLAHLEYMKKELIDEYC